MKKAVAVLYGGRSVEHEISVITALQLIEAMDSTRYDPIPVYLCQEGPWYTGEALLDRSTYLNLSSCRSQLQEVTILPKPGTGGLYALETQQSIPVDVCIMAFHGQYGEDGCVQGLLELADLPYTGCGVLSSALCMHKAHAKMLARDQGISVLPFTLVHRDDARHQLAQERTRIRSTAGLEQFPLFVKPCHLGSSIGISTAHDVMELDVALAKVFQYDELAIVEPCVTELMEVNVSVLGGHPPKASVVEIPVASGELLSFEDKYLRDGGKKSGGSSAGMASLTRVIDPQDLDPSIKEQAIADALRIFRLLECDGVARLDFIYDLAKEQLYFNEINPIPGSFSFYLWDKSHPQRLYTELIDELIALAEARYARSGQSEQNCGFKALQCS